jgi:hypothetical protein
MQTIRFVFIFGECACDSTLSFFLFFAMAGLLKAGECATTIFLSVIELTFFSFYYFSAPAHL